jgi:hypothetical protein
MNKYLIFLFLPPTAVYSQTIEADRPDQAENTHVLSPHEIQLETGFVFDHYKENKEYIGNGLLRYGLFKNIELRLLVEDGKGRDIYIEETAQGNYPLALGGKLSLLKDKAILPDITLISYVKLPFTSHNREQKKYWSPAVIIALENDLNETLDLSYNAGIKQSAFDKEYALQGAIALQWHTTKRIHLFIEYFGQYQNGSLLLHNADAGLMYFITDVLQLDLSLGSEIFVNAYDNQFAGIGFSALIK